MDKNAPNVTPSFMKNEIVALEQEVIHIASKALQFNITSTERLTEASGTREWLKEKIKFLKGHKELLYRPYKDKIDAINEVYKPIEKMLTEAEKAISISMGSYQTAEVARAKSEADAIASRVKEGKGYLKPETAMEKIANIETPAILADTNFVNRPKLSITNINVIPKEYFIVDEKKLEADLKSGKVVPGAILVDNYEPRTR